MQRFVGHGSKRTLITPHIADRSLPLMDGEGNLVYDRNFGRKFGDLKSAHQAAVYAPVAGPERDIPAVQVYVASIRIQETGDLVHQGGFTSTVWTNEGQPLSCLQGQRDVIGDMQTTKRFPEIFDSK